MHGLGLEARPTIDRRWLERAEATDPLAHAYALWDLDRTPQAVRFVSALRGEETVGYLLVWLGRGDRPVVHWYGPPEVAEVLLGGLPAPPFDLVVPPEAEVAVARAFPGLARSQLRQMLRFGSGLPTVPGARRLEREDRAALAEMVRSRSDAELSSYAALDPGSEPVWAAFDGGRIVAVARAAVRRPRIWVLGGVFVEPAWRGRGLGRAVVVAATAEGERAGARVGLYARDDPSPAIRLYEGLGFREVGRRSLLVVRTPRAR